MPSDVQALVRALDSLAAQAEGPGARAGVLAMADVGHQEITRQLTLRSHAPGTPSPSPAGQPPARITSALVRSLVATQPVPSGPAQWSVRVGPTSVYGRIHERGGVTGRNHATTLPPRPYLLPAAVALNASGRAREAGEHAFRRELGL
jgi:hypothetical protein